MLFKIFIIILYSLLLVGCSEKISYSGKIIDSDFNYQSISDKTQLLKQLGAPNFIDPIENKYFYFSEKTITKNFFDQKINDRIMIVYNFNSKQEIISSIKYNLDDENEIKFINDKTINNLTKRGLIEKMFGGVGKQQLPNTSQ